MWDLFLDCKDFTKIILETLFVWCASRSEQAAWRISYQDAGSVIFLLRKLLCEHSLGRCFIKHKLAINAISFSSSLHYLTHDKWTRQSPDTIVSVSSLRKKRSLRPLWDTFGFCLGNRSLISRRSIKRPLVKWHREDLLLKKCLPEISEGRQPATLAKCVGLTEPAYSPLKSLFNEILMNILSSG